MNVILPPRDNTLLWIGGLSSALILAMTVADFAAVKFLDFGFVITPAGAMLFGEIGRAHV